MSKNILTMCDSYKVSHPSHTSDDVKYNFAYLEPRGGEFSHTLSFGLQAFLTKLNEYTSPEHFNEETIEATRPVLTAHFGGNAKMVNRYLENWQYILRTHKGKLPIRIYALPEGTLSPTGHPVITVENTDPKCAWLVGWIETILQRQWYSNLVAVNSASIKNTLADYLLKTTESLAGLEFMLHDFGARAATSEESAEIAAAAHLLNFKGTDTLAVFDYINDYYGSDDKSFIAGFSVPASEHGSTTSYQRYKTINFSDIPFDRNKPSPDLQKAYEHIFRTHAEQYKDLPFGIISIVIDTEGNPRQTAKWLCEKFATVWSKEYPNIRMVLRPDSGEPEESVLETFKIVEEAVGCHENEKTKFKEFNANIGVIQGDGICESSIHDICETLVANQYSVKDLVFGMGGSLHQSEKNRDTQQVAYKSSCVTTEDEAHHLHTHPVGKETSSKKSKPGRLMVYDNGQGDYVTGAIPEPSCGFLTEADMKKPLHEVQDLTALDTNTGHPIPEGFKPALRPIYENGELLHKESFQVIRERAEQALLALRVKHQGSLRYPDKPDLRTIKKTLKQMGKENDALKAENEKLKALVAALQKAAQTQDKEQPDESIGDAFRMFAKSRDRAGVMPTHSSQNQP